MRKKSKKRPEHEGQQLAQTSGYPMVKLLFKWNTAVCREYTGSSVVYLMTFIAAQQEYVYLLTCQSTEVGKIKEVVSDGARI